MNINIDLICGLGSNSVEHCLGHVTHLKRNIMLITQPMNTFSFSFCYLKPGTRPDLLLLSASALGAAWLICTMRISSTIPPSCPSHAASYGILLVLPNLKCERERARELKRAECGPKRFYLGLVSLKERGAFPSAASPRPRRWRPLPSVSLSSELWKEQL